MLVLVTFCVFLCITLTVPRITLISCVLLIVFMYYIQFVFRIIVFWYYKIFPLSFFAFSVQYTLFVTCSSMCILHCHQRVILEKHNQRHGDFPVPTSSCIIVCSQPYDRSTLKLGQHFQSVEYFKDTLRNIVIRQNFDFIFIINNKLWVIVRCTALDW